jgi:hypothetical protein
MIGFAIGHRGGEITEQKQGDGKNLVPVTKA